MELYVGNIPATLTKEQLKAFFVGYEKHATFKIKTVKNGNEIFTFGLVDIPSDSKAKKAIRRLNLKRIDGKLIVVREYVHRVSQNDRRALNWRNKKWQAAERRNNDRRTFRVHKNADLDAYFNDWKTSASI